MAETVLAETLLSFGVEKLWDLLVRESERLQGFDEQFKVLKRDLKRLRSFLKDADTKKHASETVRDFVEEIKEIVFDAEDIIETFLLKEELRKTSGIRQRMRRLSCIILDRREIALEMGDITKRISKVIRDMESFGVQPLKIVEGGEYSHPLQERQREIRKTFLRDSENDLVGLEENVKKLVGYLVEQDGIQVVSITGMGGIGKTTLARQVCNHEMVKNHFDGVAWVCISQQFERTYVWQTILRQLRSKRDGQIDLNMTEDELQEKLFRQLETSNSLIVLDDMWKEEDWDRIKPVFPSKKGWKVLLTSRNERVALHADPTCVNFKPECLTIEESWTLFRRIAFPRKDTSEHKIDEEMEEMGKKMIKHCGGLPLAVKVLGGLLGTRHTLSEWKRISENIKSHIVGGTSFNDRNISSFYHILYLSFEELPVYLKQCFLYLAHFPEDFTIYVDDLAYYWAAEGILRPRYYDGATIREVANGYIEELVKRNMVISEGDVTTSRYETCHLHDMMREVCLRKAKEENFVNIVGIANSQSPCTSRRIAVHRFNKPYHPKLKMQNLYPKLRSLLIIRSEFRREWMASDLCFTKLQLMRVLDLSYAEFEGGKLPSSIGKLIHLRYLSLYHANVTHLPSSMRNLKQLLYLNLYVDWRYPLYMPNFLKEMRELIYLCLPSKIDDKTKLELGNLVNLETLKNFSTKHCIVKDLQRMTMLRKLSINFEGKRCATETLSSSLSVSRHLEDLKIYDYTDDGEGFVLDCVNLKQLDLSIHMPKLPDEHHFPSHLTTISLQACQLVEDPMPILEILAELKELELKIQSFNGRRMVCSSGGFPRLQTLYLLGLEEWEEWIVEEGSMPLLHSLSIYMCPKLKKLPAGGFPQLHTLYLGGLKEWEEWIVEEGSMPLLHTLKIDGCKLKKLPAGGFPRLQKLKLTGLEEWEEWIVEEGSMPLLQSLNVRFCPKLKKLPTGGFSKLHKLKLVGLEEWEEWIVEEGSMPLLHILDIERGPKLKKLPAGGFPQLHKLSLRELEEWEEWIVEEGSMPLLHTLNIRMCPKLKKLEGGFLQLQELYLDGLEDWEEWIVEEGSTPLLHSLHIRKCPKLKKLPATGFPQLQKLSLRELEEWEEWIVEEGSMPLLHTLNIHMCPRLKKLEGGFPQLQKLYLSSLEKWEEWIVEEDSMPLLHTMEISDCKKLKELPDGLSLIYSLKELRMDKEWKERLLEGGEDYYKVKHIPSVKFIEEATLYYFIF